MEANQRRRRNERPLRRRRRIRHDQLNRPIACPRESLRSFVWCTSSFRRSSFQSSNLTRSRRNSSARVRPPAHIRFRSARVVSPCTRNLNGRGTMQAVFLRSILAKNERVLTDVVFVLSSIAYHSSHLCSKNVTKSFTAARAYPRL